MILIIFTIKYNGMYLIEKENLLLITFKLLLKKVLLKNSWQWELQKNL
jgi:hypothetical protein